MTNLFGLSDKGVLHFHIMTTTCNFVFNKTDLVCIYLKVSVHETFAVQEVDSLCNLQEDVQTLVELPLVRQATLSHPVLQVLLPTELHLDVQVHLQVGGACSRTL